MHKNLEDKRAYERKYYQDRKQKNPDYYLKYHRVFKYKMTPEVFEALLKSQNNRCAICGKAFETTPCVDHNHTTNENRGLLCGNCNKGLGHFLESPEIMESAIAYIKQYSKF